MHSSSYPQLGCYTYLHIHREGTGCNFTYVFCSPLGYFVCFCIQPSHSSVSIFCSHLQNTWDNVTFSVCPADVHSTLIFIPSYVLSPPILRYVWLNVALSDGCQWMRKKQAGEKWLHFKVSFIPWFHTFHFTATCFPRVSLSFFIHRLYAAYEQVEGKWG